ncbi:hypothetical protein VP01_72g1 [Puccinia sorghi]|uniref:Uncharacterized protein n=1 Tax=Puccinia sorghi TaxID=27349 RepID=A0A0L6UDU7_9BASI|nr:hypothetical protein VP01_72g1 [Puccinia sorghi]
MDRVKIFHFCGQLFFQGGILVFMTLRSSEIQGARRKFWGTEAVRLGNPILMASAETDWGGPISTRFTNKEMKKQLGASVQSFKTHNTSRAIFRLRCLTTGDQIGAFRGDHQGTIHGTSREVPQFMLFKEPFSMYSEALHEGKPNCFPINSKLVMKDWADKGDFGGRCGVKPGWLRVVKLGRCCRECKSAGIWGCGNSMGAGSGEELWERRKSWVVNTSITQGRIFRIVFRVAVAKSGERECLLEELPEIYGEQLSVLGRMVILSTAGVSVSMIYLCREEVQSFHESSKSNNHSTQNIQNLFSGCKSKDCETKDFLKPRKITFSLPTDSFSFHIGYPCLGNRGLPMHKRGLPVAEWLRGHPLHGLVISAQSMGSQVFTESHSYITNKEIGLMVSIFPALCGICLVFFSKFIFTFLQRFTLFKNLFITASKRLENSPVLNIPKQKTILRNTSFLIFISWDNLGSISPRCLNRVLSNLVCPDMRDEADAFGKQHRSKMLSSDEAKRRLRAHQKVELSWSQWIRKSIKEMLFLQSSVQNDALTDLSRCSPWPDEKETSLCPQPKPSVLPSLLSWQFY